MAIIIFTKLYHSLLFHLLFFYYFLFRYYTNCKLAMFTYMLTLEYTCGFGIFTIITYWVRRFSLETAKKKKIVEFLSHVHFQVAWLSCEFKLNGIPNVVDGFFSHFLPFPFLWNQSKILRKIQEFTSDKTKTGFSCNVWSTTTLRWNLKFK